MGVRVPPGAPTFQKRPKPIADLYEISKSHTAAEQRKAIVSLVESRRLSSRQENSTFYDALPRRYDLYRGTYTHQFHRHRSNIHIPLIFSLVQADVARKMLSIFPKLPYVEFYGVGPEDGPLSRMQTELVAAQMRDCRFFEKAYDFMMTADLYGTGIMQVGWDHEEKDRISASHVYDPETGEPIRDQKIERVVSFDGPNVSPKDPLDCCPQPGVNDIQDMDWFIHEYWIDYDKYRARAEAGIYDKRSLKDLKNSNFNEGEMNDRASVQRHDRDGGIGTSMYDRPIKITEMWGTVPDELIPPGSNQMKSRLISIANGTVLARNHNNPLWHGRIPFYAHSPFRDPHVFFAAGKCEIAERMQALVDRYASHRSDILDVTVDPMMAMDATRGIDPEQLVTRAGGVIEVDGPVDDSVIRPIQWDMAGVDHIPMEIEMMWRHMQTGTGVIEGSEMMGGTGSTKRQTAHEFQGRQEGALGRIALEIRLAEESWLQPIADTFVALNRQFLEKPRRIQILGRNALIDPITQQPVRDLDVDLNVMQRSYDARARGYSRMVHDGIRQRDLMTLFQLFGANPALASMTNWQTFAYSILDSMDGAAPDEVLQLSDEQMELNARLLGLGDGPPTGGGAGSQPAISNANGIQGGTLGGF